MNNSKQLTREPGCDNVLRLRCEPIEQPRIGFVGVGVRGQRAVARMMHIEGAVVAATFLVGKEAGLYGMRDMLG